MISARIFCSFSSNASLFTRMDMVSIPEGMCSMETPLSSKDLKDFPAETDLGVHHRLFNGYRCESRQSPAIPVIVYFGWRQVLSTISVPLSSGRFVLRMLIGIPALRTGKMASS